MFCSNCGRENSGEAVHCAGCGAPLPAAEQPVIPGEIPHGIKGFNFGALALNGIWCLGHRLWLWAALMFLLPVAGVAFDVLFLYFKRGPGWHLLIFLILPLFIDAVFAIYLGVKGNELAWETGRFTDVTKFKNNQRIWIIAGIICIPVYMAFMVILTSFLLAIIIPRFTVGAKRSKVQICEMNLSNINKQVEAYYFTEGMWPQNDLSDIKTNNNYFPDGMPTCPVDLTSYVLVPSTHRVSGHREGKGTHIW